MCSLAKSKFEEVETSVQEQKYSEANKLINLSKKQRNNAKKILMSIIDYPPAKFLLAVIIQGSKKKNKKADILLKEAAPFYLATTHENEAERLTRIASYYHFGLAGTKQDFHEAFKWFTFAADKNDPKAQLFLSRYYSRGTVVPQDLVKSFELVEKAAFQNDPEALCTLGHCYAGGHGVEKDIKKAGELLTKAMSLGSKKAKKLYRAFYLANYSNNL